jgi:hypothetical protein
MREPDDVAEVELSCPDCGVAVLVGVATRPGGRRPSPRRATRGTR